MFQHTIKKKISCTGIGLHSGKKINLEFIPAPANTGIAFLRTDIPAQNNVIQAHWSNVSAELSTILKNNHGVGVRTIEHILAAAYGYNLDNLIVKMDSFEAPIMDGSSFPFIELFKTTGIEQLDAPKRYLKILKPIKIQDGDREIVAIPSKKFSIKVKVCFDNKNIGTQSCSFDEHDSFTEKISKARAFFLLEELPSLRSKNLAIGADTSNAIIVGENQIINSERLRYSNEFATHKLLDSLGDFYLATGPIIAEVHSFKPGHWLNNVFLKKIFESKNNYRWINLI